MSGVYGKEASLHYTDFLAENQLAALRKGWRAGIQNSREAAQAGKRFTTGVEGSLDAASLVAPSGSCGSALAW